MKKFTATYGCYSYGTAFPTLNYLPTPMSTDFVERPIVEIPQCPYPRILLRYVLYAVGLEPTIPITLLLIR